MGKSKRNIKETKSLKSLKSAKKLKHKVANYQPGAQKNGKSTASAQASNSKAKGQKRQYIPFTNEDRILIVGDGDLSFSVSILDSNFTTSDNLIITIYDSFEEIKEKYDSSAVKNLQILQQDYGFEPNVNLFEKVDCQNFKKSLGKAKYAKVISSFKPTMVLFNFPHLGNSMTDVARNINAHQKFMLKFFEQCKQLGKESGQSLKIAVTIFAGEPYDSWNLKVLAKQMSLKLLVSGNFDWSLYPEYAHKTTSKVSNTSKPFNQRIARTFTFTEFRSV